MDNSYGLLKVQKANLILLEEIDRICRKHNISYMLDAGTLLGAIRHGGFIPWDDDADIAVRRQDWEVFRRVARMELREDFTLLTPQDLSQNNKFYDFTPRFIYNKSIRRKAGKEDEYYGGKLNHLWVDIFILDNLPNAKLSKKLVLSLQKLIYLLSMGHRYRLDYKKYSLLQKICIFIISNIGKVIPMKTLYKLQNNLSKAFNKKNVKKVYYSNYQPDYIDISLDKSCIEKTTYIQFEDSKLSIPESYEEILRTVYGDYMKLPPKSQRVATHGSFDIEVYG